MSVLVDTCIWSYALRRQNNALNQKIIDELNNLIHQRQVIMLSAIRQEILSGIAHESQFERIRTKLRAFSDYPISTADFETAAQFYNRCRAKGVQASNTDFLLCAIAHCHDFTVFTLDKDFYHFKKHLDFKLNLIERS
ncbi:MAG: PIN domain-containing protein [Methylococcales bacterium]